MIEWAPWVRLASRYAFLRWLERWGVSVASVALGCLALFVFRRGLPHVGWIVGYLLLLCLSFAALVELRASLEERGRHLIVGAGEYAIQTLYHGLSLFVLPGYYATVTLDSMNVVFLAPVAATAIVTAVDPWYLRVVSPRPWLGHALFAFSIFAALNVALPLVGIRPILALEGAAVLAVLALTPVFRRHGAIAWRGALARAAALACLAALIAWFARGMVPPAPIFLVRAVAARGVQDHEPVDVIEGSVPAATVAQWGQIAAYTAISAPGGLRQEILHVWRKNGAVIARISLSPVQGGRAQGFRTWSLRRDLRPPLAGRYTVDVVTASSQLVGRLRFRIKQGMIDR